MMLDLKNRPAFIENSPEGDDGEVAKTIDAARLFIVRRYKMITVIFILGVLVGLGYLKITRPSYTAFAGIDIVNREGRFLQQQATLAEAPADVDRAITLVKSSKVSEIVARKLHLDKDVEFDPPASGLLARLRTLWSAGIEDPDSVRMRTTVASIQSATRVTADASGGSFSIAFTSYDPVKAAGIANAIADAFLSYQDQADSEVHTQATNWLVDQSNELGKRAKEAETAVAEFIKANNMTIVSGKSLDQLKLEDVNKRVADAKDKLVDAQYKIDKISVSVASAAVKDILDVTSTTEISQDPAIAKSRDRYLDLSSQLRAVQHDYGKDSQVLRDLIAATKSEILTELARLQINARNDYQLAAKHYDDVVAEQKSDVSASQNALLFQGQLKALEDTAQNYRTLYQNFLQHSAESVQELSFPVRATRISERATTPLDKSWPRPLIVLAAAALGGLALGVGVSALRDFSDGTFRTAAQLESSTSLRCIGIVPKSTISTFAMERCGLPAEFIDRFKLMRPPPVWLGIKTGPNSRFVSELIAVRLSLRSYANLHGAKVFGFTSALTGEGKSTLVGSLGVLMAQSGYRVVVVDLDFRYPTLTNSFVPDGGASFSDVLAGDRTLDDVLVRDHTLSLSIVPCIANASALRSVELLTSAKMRASIVELRRMYDFVLIDLPPLVPVADVRATTEFIDGYVIAVEWATTNIALLNRAIESCSEIKTKLVGGVLNKVNFKMLSKYDPLANSYYMGPKVSRYLEKE